MSPDIPRPLVAICLKAMSKNPQDRYPSARALADDIEHWMADEPVSAYHETLPGQFRRWGRRNPWAPRFVAMLLVAFFATSALATWALRSEVTARTERDRAESEAATSKAIGDFFQNLLAQASAEGQAGRTTTPDPHLEVRTVLDRAAGNIGREFTGRPLVEASIRQTIGEAYLNLALFTESQDHLERSLTLFKQELGETDTRTLKIMEDLGQLHLARGELDKSASFLIPARATRERVGASLEINAFLALDSLGELYRQQGNMKDAETTYKQALDDRLSTFGADHPDVLAAMNNLGTFYMEQGRLRRG